MKENIRIRAHHGMCLAFFEGKGYSEDFSRHMQSVSDMLRKDPELEIIADSDLICRKCPNLKDGACCTYDLVKGYDSKVLSLCGLTENSKISWSEFSSLIKDRILRAGKREQICGDCEWNEICRAHERFYAG